jgi:hypothetical protein
MQGGSTQIIHDDGSTETRASATCFGLPVIGFVAKTCRNGTLSGPQGAVRSNYAGSQPFIVHRRVE